MKYIYYKYCTLFFSILFLFCSTQKLSAQEEDFAILFIFTPATETGEVRITARPNGSQLPIDVILEKEGLLHETGQITQFDEEFIIDDLPVGSYKLKMESNDGCYADIEFDFLPCAQEIASGIDVCKKHDEESGTDRIFIMNKFSDEVSYPLTIILLDENGVALQEKVLGESTAEVVFNNLNPGKYFVKAQEPQFQCSVILESNTNCASLPNSCENRLKNSIRVESYGAVSNTSKMGVVVRNRPGSVADEELYPLTIDIEDRDHNHVARKTLNYSDQAVLFENISTFSRAIVSSEDCSVTYGAFTREKICKYVRLTGDQVCPEELGEVTIELKDHTNDYGHYTINRAYLDLINIYTNQKVASVSLSSPTEYTFRNIPVGNYKIKGTFEWHRNGRLFHTFHSTSCGIAKVIALNELDIDLEIDNQPSCTEGATGTISIDFPDDAPQIEEAIWAYDFPQNVFPIEAPNTNTHLHYLQAGSYYVIYSYTNGCQSSRLIEVGEADFIPDTEYKFNIGDPYNSDFIEVASCQDGGGRIKIFVESLNNPNNWNEGQIPHQWFLDAPNANVNGYHSGTIFADDLMPGLYPLKFKNAEGCVLGTQLIEVPTYELVIEISDVIPQCAGEENGQIKYYIANFVTDDPVTVSINGIPQAQAEPVSSEPNEFNGHIKNLSTGQYIIEARAGDCVVSKSVDVKEADPLQIRNLVTEFTCDDQSVGSISFTILGDHPPFYINGELWVNPGGNERRVTLDDLDSGNHQIQIAGYCQSTTGSFEIEEKEFPEIEVVRIEDCPTGLIELPEVENVNYKWENGSNWLLRQNLNPGEYKVTATFGNCTEQKSFTIHDTQISYTIEQGSCSSDQVTLKNINAGTAPTTVKLFKDGTQFDEISIPNSNEFNLPISECGDITIEMQDSRGCSLQQTIQYFNPCLEVDLTKQEVGATEDTNYEVTLFINNINNLPGNFYYEWAFYNPFGNTWPLHNSGIDENFFSTEHVAGTNDHRYRVYYLPPGVSDPSMSCLISEEVFTTRTKCSVAGRFNYTSEVTHDNLTEENAGSITLTETEGQGTATYSWRYNDTGENLGGGSAIENLRFGSYTVTITTERCIKEQAPGDYGPGGFEEDAEYTQDFVINLDVDCPVISVSHWEPKQEDPCQSLPGKPKIEVNDPDKLPTFDGFQDIPIHLIPTANENKFTYQIKWSTNPPDLFIGDHENTVAEFNMLTRKSKWIGGSQKVKVDNNPAVTVIGTVIDPFGCETSFEFVFGQSEHTIFQDHRDHQFHGHDHDQTCLLFNCHWNCKHEGYLAPEVLSMDEVVFTHFERQRICNTNFNTQIPSLADNVKVLNGGQLSYKPENVCNPCAKGFLNTADGEIEFTDGEMFVNESSLVRSCVNCAGNEVGSNMGGRCVRDVGCLFRKNGHNFYFSSFVISTVDANGQECTGDCVDPFDNGGDSGTGTSGGDDGGISSAQALCEWSTVQDPCDESILDASNYRVDDGECAVDISTCGGSVNYSNVLLEQNASAGYECVNLDQNQSPNTSIQFAPTNGAQQCFYEVVVNNENAGFIDGSCFTHRMCIHGFNPGDGNTKYRVVYVCPHNKNVVNPHYVHANGFPGVNPNLNPGVYDSKTQIYDQAQALGVEINCESGNLTDDDCQFESHFNASISESGDVIFEDQSESRSNVSITQWLWDFGDGNTSNRQHPTHQYQQDGQYLITLTVSDDSGECTDTYSYIFEYTTPCQATAYFDYFEIESTEKACKVVFEDLSSYQGNSTPLSWSWDFGDGNFVSTNDPSVEHTYEANGSYNVTLTLYFESGEIICDQTVQDVVNVNCIPDQEPCSVEASFTYSEDPTYDGCLFTFTDNSFFSEGITPIYYLWDFGDGNFIESTDDQVSHIYENKGSHTVFLFAEGIDQNGNRCSDSYAIKVTSLCDVIHENVDICQGESYYAQGAQQSQTGIYEDIIYGFNNSVYGIYTHLTVNPNFEIYQEVKLCTNETYILPDGREVNQPDIYSSFLETTAGCDSIITTFLEIHKDNSYNESVEICQGDSHTLIDGSIVLEQGLYETVLFDYNNCPYTVYTYLALIPIDTIVVDAKTCHDQAYTLPDGTKVRESGTYFSSVNQEPCNVIYQTNLSVLKDYSYYQEVFICQGEKYILPDGTKVSQENKYEVIVDDHNGCPMTVITKVSFFKDQSFTEKMAVCKSEQDSYTLPDGKKVDKSGTYSVQFTDDNGCQAKHIIDLLFFDDQSFTEEDYFCPGDSYTLRDGTIVDKPGTYNVTIKDKEGCPANITTYLSVVPDLSTYEKVNLCRSEQSSYTLPNGHKVSQNGIYEIPLIDYYGCNATQSFEITFFEDQSYTTSDVFCYGDSYILPDGSKVQKDGPHNVIIADDNGCNMSVTTYLKYYPDQSTYQNVSLCASQQDYFILSDGTKVEKSGTYDIPFIDDNGCNAIHSTNVIFYKDYSETKHINVCEANLKEGYELPNGELVDTSGIYINEFIDSDGCPYDITTNLTIYPDSSSIDTVLICPGVKYELPDGKFTDKPGVYDFEFKDIYGCIYSNVIVLEFYKNYYILDIVLCEGESYILPNGKKVEKEGIYIVSEVKEGDCKVTTEFRIKIIKCDDDNKLKRNKNLKQNIRVIPNPVSSSDQFVLQFDSPQDHFSVNIFDTKFNKVDSKDFEFQQKVKQVQLITPKLSGVYIINVTTKEWNHSIKLVVKE